MRLEPRDSFFDQGNKIFADQEGEILKYFNCYYSKDSGNFIYAQYEIEHAKSIFRLTLDAGLPFWSEIPEEYAFDENDSSYLGCVEIIELASQRIKDISWFPDVLNSKILFKTDLFILTIKCRQSEIFDSEITYELSHDC